MYFWNYKKLAVALQNNAISQRQFYIYLAFFILWFAILFIPAESSPVDSLIQVMGLAYTFLWLATSYWVNKKGDGKHYFKRLVCLDLPITLRCLGLYIVLFVLAAFLNGLIAGFIQVEGIFIPEAAIDQFSIAHAAVLAFIYSFVININAFKIASGQIQ